tara:strand:- start:762 stop:1304 length:543 start_codon:yes stop_codon:yes gene_type:complete
MNNIKILKKGIDVSKVLDQLEQYSDDWYIQRKGTDTLLERGYADIEVGNLQLIMGAIKKKDDFVGDSELNKLTPAWERHTEIIKIINKELPKREVHRCGFLSLPVDGYVGAHIDEGTYYLTRDRYHLSIAGQYQYFVGNETAIVDAGTLFWFNNKMPHGAVNLGEETRITFVFDMPHELY